MFSFRAKSSLLSLLALVAFQFSGFASADEIVIGDNVDTCISLGGFQCSSCPHQLNRGVGLFNPGNSGQVSAGELWQYFSDQGINTLDRLTLCLDIEQMENSENFGLNSIEFKIEDPLLDGSLLTHVSLGDNTLIVPATETSEFKPEAKLEIILGYDFMERFSAASNEKIQLDFSSNTGLASNAQFSIGASEYVFSRFNLLMLVGFAVFWAIVFFVLNRVTKPLEEEALEVAASAQVLSTPQKNAASKRALSA